MIEYHHYAGMLPPDVLRAIVNLEVRVFERQIKSLEEEEQRLAHRITTNYNIMTFAAFDGERLVAFKIGYEERDHTFYSWLGCVQPEYRRQGIAGELMRRQHEWCREQGYRFVRTDTRNQFRNMLILNIRHGFDICGTIHDGRGGMKIQLQKKL